MSAQQKKRVDIDGGRAWIVLLASYSSVIILNTILYMNGLYLAVLVEYYNEDLTKTSMIGALNIALLCLLAPLVSVFMDAYSCRICAVVGGLLLSTSYFISFFVKSVDVYIFTIGIIGGVGNSFAAIPQSVLIAYHFDRWRNIFISFKEVLIGTGMLLASPVLYSFIDMFGVNGSFLIVSGLSLQIIVCGLCCSPNSKEREMWKSKCNETKGTQDSTSNNFMQKVKSNALLSLGLCKDIQFILFMFSTLTWNLILYAVSLHLPNYMVDNGFQKADLVTVMMIFGLSNTLGRFCAASTTGKGGLDGCILHIGTIGVLSLVAILFPLYGGWSSAVFLFSALVGFYTGCPNALMVTLTIDLVGIEKLTSAYGLSYFFCGIGVFAGPPFLGIVYQVTESYGYSFMTVGFIGIIGVIVSMMAFRTKNTQEKTQERELEIYSQDDTVIRNLLGEETPDGVEKKDRTS